MALVPLIRLAAGNKYMCVELSASLSWSIDGRSLSSPYRHNEPDFYPFPQHSVTSRSQFNSRYQQITAWNFAATPKMASHHDEDTMPEETQGYKLSQPKQSLAEYQQMGMSINTFQNLLLSQGTRSMAQHMSLSASEFEPSMAASKIPWQRASAL